MYLGIHALAGTQQIHKEVAQFATNAPLAEGDIAARIRLGFPFGQINAGHQIEFADIQILDMAQFQRFADGDALLALQQGNQQIIDPDVVIFGKQQHPLLIEGVLHQLLDQHLGHGDREGNEFGLLVEQLFEGDTKRG